MKITYTARFLHDLDRLHKQLGRDLDLDALYTAVELLAAGQVLPPTFRDHPLHTHWQGYRDFHIGPDQLIIYQLREREIVFRRAGTHSALFSK